MAKCDAGYRYGVSDWLWSRLEPLIPKPKNRHPFGGSRPRVPDRQCLEGILFVLRTGCQWKALDATGICSGSTAHSRFQEWAEAGVFREFWRQGLWEYDELQGIDWEWLSVDGANRHDMKLLQPTLHHMPLCYPPLSKHRVHVCLDKGYDYNEIRQYLRGAGFVPHVRSRGEEKKALEQAPHDLILEKDCLCLPLLN